MDKQAFKQRMQNLKSYRENNPGKGYWDWKVESFENGGEVTRKSLKDIRKESIIEGKLDYDTMLQNQNAYQKEFATNWYKERAKNPKYSSQLGGNKIDPNPDLYYTKEQFTILDKWQQNSYFTNDEKDFIINYLIDCLVEGQPFDCSSLGPNKYLNE